jgi:nicotinate dehydrogenase subunit B
MSTPPKLEPGHEPERYEFAEDPAYRFGLDRRQFLGTLAAGLLVLFVLDEAPAQESGGGRRGGGGNVPQEIGAWLHVAEDGRVTVFTGKVEVGQNIRSSLAQAVAEDLRVALDTIHMVMGDTDLTPYDAGTFGSQTTPSMAPRLRRMAAAAREALLDLAAAEWGVDTGSLAAADGRVTETATGRTADYGKLTRGQRLTRTVAGDPPTTPPQAWTVAGHAVGKADGRAFVTGTHQYTPDVKLPGMLHGKVLRPPSFGATVATVDTKAAEALPGSVVVRDGDFVGVAAPTEQQARHAVAAIRAEWKAGPAIVSSEELFEELKRQGRAARGVPAASAPQPSPEGARLDEAYHVAYIAHAPLEPRAAVASWEDGKLTVWTGTQRPFGVRAELAQAFRIPEDKVRVIVPDTGSGYGGKHTGEAALEAARLAKAAGKPVKLVWTREEEFTWAYFRPAGVIEVSAAARPDGTLSAWEFYNYNSGGSGLRSLYEAPNPVERFIPVNAPLRQGSYRGLAATANHFARETALDELAHALRLDPLEFRLKNLKDARLRAVLEAAAKAFGWGGKAPAGHGFGIAGGSEKGGYLATCAEVAADAKTGAIRVVRAVSAFECGAVVSPDHLRNQVEGALVMGIGGALSEEIRFADGKITNARFSKYRVPRFSDAPKIETVLLDRKDLPSAGAGETPIVAIAPAIGNAVFAATGVRLRSLPLKLDSSAKSR